jgi:hypothetical protein
VLWLERDGLTTLGVVGSDDYLGWAVNQGTRRQKEDPTLINSTTLVEVTLEFCRFVHVVLLPRVRGPWTLRIAARGLQSRSGGLLLAEGPPHAFSRHESRPASEDETEWDIPVSDSAGADAFALLETLYASYGFGSSAVPYADSARVQEDVLKAVR